MANLSDSDEGVTAKCDSCDSYFRTGNVEYNFIIIYIIYYIYNNIVEIGENLIVTTVTDSLWSEKKFVTLQADSRIMCAGSTAADAVARTRIIN